MLINYYYQFMVLAISVTSLALTLPVIYVYTCLY